MRSTGNTLCQSINIAKNTKKDRKKFDNQNIKPLVSKNYEMTKSHYILQLIKEHLLEKAD